MRVTRITTLAATALIAVASLVGGTVALATSARASIEGKGEGTGTTLQAAEAAALNMLRDDYYGCKAPPYYYDYGQNANGTWHAWVEESCTGVY